MGVSTDICYFPVRLIRTKSLRNIPYKWMNLVLFCYCHIFLSEKTYNKCFRNDFRFIGIDISLALEVQFGP